MNEDHISKGRSGINHTHFITFWPWKVNMQTCSSPFQYDAYSTLHTEEEIDFSAVSKADDTYPEVFSDMYIREMELVAPWLLVAEISHMIWLMKGLPFFPVGVVSMGKRSIMPEYCLKFD